MPDGLVPELETIRILVLKRRNDEAASRLSLLIRKLAKAKYDRREEW
ncbi:MAG: hypothetical protein JRD89_21245, partial [Deltaproteobacteria bacterium]|nr:hypothetical protein [Deltaproteobacteria bacterium]